MWSLLADLYASLLVPRYRYTDSYNQLKARVTLLYSAVIGVFSFLVILGLAFSRQQDTFVNTGLFLSFLILLFQGVITFLVQSGQLRVGTFLLFAMLTAAGIFAVWSSGIDSSLILTLVVPLMYGAFIFPWNNVAVIGVAEAVLVIVVGFLEARGQLPGVVASDNAHLAPYTLLATVTLSGATLLASAFSYELARVFRSGGRTITQLRATGEIAQIAAVSGGSQELMQRTVNYIRDRFGFYHVQIFLLDAEKRYANLTASTGEAGDVLLQRGYRLAVGSTSSIGRALQVKEPVIISGRDAEPTSVYRTHELLRDTRSELALPLIAGEQAIGVLDVQSTRVNAFAPELVDSLRILATQVSVSIYNARQLEEQKMALDDTRRLFLEAEVSLREAQRLNQRLTGQAWEDYLKTRTGQSIGYTLSESRLQRDQTWTPGLEQAAGNRRAVIDSQQERQVLAVPIELRGRVLGAIEVEIAGLLRQAETLEILQSVSQRLALSIDNARLFEQAQELAQREMEINSISTTLQGINDLNELARATVQELGQALGASQASIRIGTLDVHGEEPQKS